MLPGAGARHLCTAGNTVVAAISWNAYTMRSTSLERLLLLVIVGGTKFVSKLAFAVADALRIRFSHALRDAH